jgi:hypothetical protein
MLPPWLVQAAPLSPRDRELRRFAVWCARRAWRHAGAQPFRALVEAAEARVRGGLSQGALEALWERFRGGAGAAFIMGVGRGIPSAAAQLAAFQSARPDPAEAAKHVIDHTAQTAGLVANRLALEKGLIPLRPEQRESSYALADAKHADPRFFTAAGQAERAFLEQVLRDWLRGVAE